jgi:Ca2+-binding RTX toxin-like protein
MAIITGTALARTDVLNPGLFDLPRYVTSAVIGGVTYIYNSETVGDPIQVSSLSADGTLTLLGTVPFTRDVSLSPPNELDAFEVNGASFLAVAGSGSFYDGVTIFALTEAAPYLTRADAVFDSQDPATNLSGGRAVEALTLAGGTFVYVSGVGSDGLSVFSVDGSGGLTNVQNIDDDGARALDFPSGMAAFSIGATQYLVVTGAGDRGLSVFSVDPTTGHLTSVADYYFPFIGAFSSFSPGALDVAVIDGMAHFYVGGINDFTVMTFDGSVMTEIQSLDGLGRLLDHIEVFAFGDRQLLAVTSGESGQLTLLEIETDPASGTPGQATPLQTVMTGEIRPSRDAQDVHRVTIDDTTFLVVAASGSFGLEVYEVGGGDDLLVGLASDDALYGGGGDDTLRGLDGADLLVGDRGNDALFGGRGDDTLRGGLGDDTIAGDIGIDSMDGGAGTDTADFTHTNADVTFDLAAGTADFGGGVAETMIAFEALIAGGGADTLVGADGQDNLLSGGAGDDSIRGGDGDDTIAGGIGIDAMDGGDGVDTVDFTHTDVDADFSLAAGQADFGGGIIETMVGFETIVAGGGDNVLTGDAFANRLEGGAGDDWIAGGIGIDTMDGGLGLDTVDFTHTGADADFDLSAGLADFGGGIVETMVGFETVVAGAGDNRITGSGEANRLDGGAGDDTLNGGDGDDWIAGGIGIDSMNGGLGLDTVDFTHTGADADFDLSASLADFGGGIVETMVGFENVVAGAGDNTITGDDLDNRLEGGAGDDTITGGAGDDWIAGGTGIDALYGGTGFNNTVDFTHTNADATYDLQNDVADFGNGIVEIMQGFENVVAGGGDNILIGTVWDNRLVGGGDDTFVFVGDNFGDDVVVDFSSDDAEKIDLSGVPAITDFTDLMENHLESVDGTAMISHRIPFSSFGLQSILLENVAFEDVGVGRAYDADDFIF